MAACCREHSGSLRMTSPPARPRTTRGLSISKIRPASGPAMQARESLSQSGSRSLRPAAAAPVATAGGFSNSAVPDRGAATGEGGSAAGEAEGTNPWAPAGAAATAGRLRCDPMTVVSRLKSSAPGM